MLRPLLPLLAALTFASIATATPVDEYALKALEAANPPAALPPSPTANVVSYSGTNAGGTSWARPFADGTCCSGLGPVTLHTQQFNLSGGDTCAIESIQNGYDGYIFVYTSPFDPTQPTVNFRAGDDDGNGGIGTSNIDGLALEGNRTYILVTTGFENGDAGTFTNTITCPTAVVSLGAFVPPPPQIVPTTSASVLSLLAAALGLVAVWTLRRHTPG